MYFKVHFPCVQAISIPCSCQGARHSLQPSAKQYFKHFYRDKRQTCSLHGSRGPQARCAVWPVATTNWHMGISASTRWCTTSGDNTVSLDSNLFLSKMKQNRINLIYLKPTMAHLVAESQCLDSISRTKGNTSFIWELCTWLGKKSSVRQAEEAQPSLATAITAVRMEGSKAGSAEVRRPAD